MLAARVAEPDLVRRSESQGTAAFAGVSTTVFVICGQPRVVRSSDFTQMWAMSVDGFFALAVHLYSQWSPPLATSAAHSYSVWLTSVVAADGVHVDPDGASALVVAPVVPMTPAAAIAAIAAVLMMRFI